MSAAAIFTPGPRRSIALGGTLLLAGLATVGVGASDGGAALSLGGLAILIFGVHAFGRSGEDEPVEGLDADEDDGAAPPSSAAPKRRRATKAE